MKSQCCDAAVSIEGEGLTHYHSCVQCHQPCDISYSIEQPNHYQFGEYQARDIAKMFLSRMDRETTFWDAHCLATALYYWLRAGKKGPFEEDCKKAAMWIKFMKEE